MKYTTLIIILVALAALSLIGVFAFARETKQYSVIDLNKDGIVDLKDYSMWQYEWDRLNEIK